MKIHKSNRNWLSLLLLLIIAITASIDLIVAQNSTSYAPAENILLNCGASSRKQTALDGRSWVGDVGSSYAPGIQIPPTVPYMTARIFQIPYTYSFPVIPSRKFVRLYFYPLNYTNPNFVVSDSFFSVSIGPHTPQQLQPPFDYTGHKQGILRQHII
ncbi:Receptor-like protein kinase FERONIA [Acorus calamus]|uniref:Receptor-like protein kinase FERONIA n=1 Tax=Acorus calamus TaxID=4465 RepID=A0AAV9C762_ACOCL|nr:Receptor-like protein kinase FERONIA [Acorus calamus]